MYTVEEFENQAKKQGFKLKKVNLLWYLPKKDGNNYVLNASTEIDKKNLRIIWDEEGKAYCQQIRFSGENNCIIFYNVDTDNKDMVMSEDLCYRNERFDLHFKREIVK